MADDESKDPLALLQQHIHKHAEKAQQRREREAADTPKQMFLQGFDIGAMPNHLNRSSFIAPIARGRRRFHRQTEMVSRKDCVLEYTGEQLDEADGDLVMALIFFAQPQSLGTPVPLRRIRALTEGTLYIEAKKPDGSTRYQVGRSVAFHIISSFHYDDEMETYTYTLDPRWVQIFGNKEYALIDWDKRMEIARGQDMAKALQRLVATSADQLQRYALD
ncbi:MAG: hypothetical protein JZU52_11425, partial [Lamprocystis purpurea]|nr:hypothetical protein [Lamprocystis purpurea]